VSQPPPDSVPDAVPHPVPVCPRHPDRESYVRCQRCERPVCPQCQRTAPVGVQCVDCVKAQAKTIRVPRTVFGGSVGTTSWVTYAIMTTCVLVFLAQNVLAGDPVTNALAFAPFLAKAQPWRFLTDAFVHSPGNLLHIGFNMYVLWQFGPHLERLLGWARYLAMYLLSALGCSVGVLLLASPSDDPSTAWWTPVVGASGAIFGVLGAVIAVNRKQGLDSRTLWIWIGINAVIGFIGSLHISWQGHLGGLVTGLACGAALAYAPAARRTPVQVGALLGVLVLLVLVTVAKLATAQGYLV
jgi:membrane associated rhomboid family serine protease